jgi:hypothetical protein
MVEALLARRERWGFPAVLRRNRAGATHEVPADQRDAQAQEAVVLASHQDETGSEVRRK